MVGVDRQPSGELQDFILNTGKGEDWRKDFAEKWQEYLKY